MSAIQMSNRVLATLAAGVLSAGFGECNDEPIDDDYCDGVKHCNALGECEEGPAPCDDGEACTVDTCDEVRDRCGHDARACLSTCASDCLPDCSGLPCGGDGCGSSCGECGTGLECAYHSNACENPQAFVGSCQSPIAIPFSLGKQVIRGSTVNGLQVLVPTCNSLSQATELVYSLSVSEPTGIDARVFGFDSVLSLRALEGCLDDSEAATIDCSDDDTPPGDFGSRVSALLQSGDYALIVDGFDVDSFGPFELSLNLVAGCVPECASIFCGGDDGCGGDCGACGPDEVCVVGGDRSGTCAPIACTPDCSGKECGADGCGGECGACLDGELCRLSDQQCEAFPICDHFAPQCAGCTANEWCGSDCACHTMAEALPDLVVSEELLANHYVSVEEISPASCMIAEGCVRASGVRTLLRFSMMPVNQGQVALQLPDPAERPDLFEHHPCHNHYHYKEFAEYELLRKSTGDVVAEGSKQSFCMEDSAQVLDSPAYNCRSTYTCEAQGISAGWGDEYGPSLDCQFVDVTDVSAAPGEPFILRATANTGRAFVETSFDNNTGEVEVVLVP